MHGAAGPSRMEYLIRSIRKFSASWYWDLRPALPDPSTPAMPNLEGFVKAYDHFTVENAHPVATDTIWFSMFCHRLSSHVPIVKRLEGVMATKGRLGSSSEWLFKLQEQSFGSLLRFLEASLTSSDSDRARFCFVTTMQVEKAYRGVTQV